MDKLYREQQLADGDDDSQISCEHLEEVVSAAALKSPTDFFATNLKEKKSRKSLKRSKEFISLMDFDKSSKDQNIIAWKSLPLDTIYKVLQVTHLSYMDENEKKAMLICVLRKSRW